MNAPRRATLFTNGSNQAIRIPRDFELAGKEALIRKQGDRLIIEPVPPPRLLAVLASLEPIDEAFPDVHDPAPEPVDPQRLLAMPKPAYLLDTNIVSGLVRRPAGHIRDRIAACGEERVCTSIIVAAELRFGAAKKGSKHLSAQLETVLSALEILPFDQPADRRYGEIRQALVRVVTPIGANDLLIAAHALAQGLTLVTADRASFAACRDWLSRTG